MLTVKNINAFNVLNLYSNPTLPYYAMNPHVLTIRCFSILKTEQKNPRVRPVLLNSNLKMAALTVFSVELNVV